MAPFKDRLGNVIDASTTDDMNNVEDVNPELLQITAEDYDAFEVALPRQEQYRADIKALVTDANLLKTADPGVVLGEMIREGNRIGGVEDITARAARDILRVKGMSLDTDADVDQVFAEYGIKLPPLNDIKFQDYESLDDEHEKLDGWAAQAKAAYNLKMRSKSPELIAYRDEVFQRIDDTAKGLKRRVGATDNGFVDFIGRLAEGAASTLDSVGLDNTANFVRKHSATNPEWDDSTSAIIGQALGQAGALVGSVLAVGSGVGAVAGAVGVSSGAAGALGALARVGTVAASSVGGVQGERRQKVLDATGSESLADAAATDASAYGEAALDTIIDLTLLGTGKLGAGKAVKSLIGLEGRALAATGLKESAMKAAGNKKLLAKIADVGGDVLWQGTKEGATEALQGAIQDTSIGQYTNMRDTFEPFDIRNRAADFLGGFAGGSGITLANTFILPKDRVQNAAPTPGVNDKDIADALVGTLTADNPADAAESNNVFIEKTADAITSTILKAKDLVGALPSTIPDATKKAVVDTTKTMYSNMKSTLGNLINNPNVQTGIEILLDNFDRSKQYNPPPRIPDAELAAQQKGTEPQPEINPAELATTPDTPALAPATAVVTEPVEAIATATQLVADPTTTADEQLNVLEKAFEGIPTLNTIDLGGGRTRYGFSLAQGREALRGTIQAAQELGLNIGKSEKATIVGAGKGIRASVSYEIDKNDDGTFSAFKIAKGKRELIDSIKTERDAAAFVDILKERDAKRTKSAKGRAEAQVRSDRFLTRAVPMGILDLVGTRGTNFLTRIRQGQGGNSKTDAHAVNAYAASEQAFEDLVDAGLSEEEALNNVARLRAVANSEFTPSTERLAAIRNVQWDVARANATPDQLSEFVNANYSKPEVRNAVRKGLGLKTDLEAVIESIPSEPVTAPESAVSQDSSSEPVTIPAPVVSPDSSIEPVLPIPSSSILMDTSDSKDLSKNKSVQRMALERRYGTAQSDKIDQLFETAKKSRQSRALLEFEADRFLKEIGVTPDDNYESAMIKASKANVGAFKTRKNVPLKRGSFALNRVFNAIGIPVTSDLPRTTTFDETTQTGAFNPSTGKVSVIRDIVGSQQAVATKWHELGEYAAQGSTDFVGDLANITGISDSLLRAEAKQVSDDIRDNPINDSREEGIDAISQYLYDKEGFTTKYPNMAEALDLFVAAEPDSFLADAVNAVTALDQVSDTQLRKLFEAEQGIGRAASVEALKTRNVDPTPTPKQLLQSLRQRIFDAGANIKDLAAEVAKLPGMGDVAQTMKRYYNQFKNREQTAALPVKAMYDYVKRVIEPLGISQDTLANYLISNRINGEVAYWEQTIRDAGLVGDDLANMFNSSPTLVELLNKDPALFDALMAEVLQGSNPVDARALVTLIQEIAAKSVATNLATQTNLMNEIAATATTPELRDAFQQAFNPKVMSRRRLDNPGGLDANDAGQMLFDMQTTLTPEQWNALNDLRTKVMAPLIVNAVEDARAAGVINDTQADYYISNKDNYVTLQMADMLASDPYIDASFTRQYGFDPSKTAADPLIVTALKTSAIKARAISQGFANNIVSMYYNAQNAGVAEAKEIKPVLYTQNLAGRNTWIDAYRRANPSQDTAAAPVDLDELYTKRAAFSFNNPNKSYVISAGDGTFVLHEVNDPTINDVLNPTALARRNEVLDALNKTQVAARMMFTTNNPVFGVRSLPKMTANLYRVSKLKSTGRTPTTLEMLKDFALSPILGIPLKKEDRALIKHAYKLAWNYMRNAGNTSDIVNAINTQFDETATFNDLLAADAIQRLVASGDILTNTASGIDPSTITELFGPSSIFSDMQDQEIDALINGTQGQKNILQRMSDYKWAGQKATRATLNAVQRYLNVTADVNNTLELAEKYLGILAFMRDGMPFKEAVVEANRYFGNPDPKGGGSARKSMSPFSLYTNSILQSMPVMYDIVANAGTSKDSNQQILKTAGMFMRNRLLTSPYVLGGMVYVTAKALGDSDDEAEKHSQIWQRLVNNIPEQDRKSGTAIPLFFRDPRSGDIIDTDDITDPNQVDPAWTSLYLSVPYDPATATISGFFGGMFDAIDKGLGVPSIVANTLTSSLGQMVPTLGPLAESGLALSAIARGQNPTNTFTGQNVVSDEEFEAGGATLGLRYAQYLASHFMPMINFDKKDPGDKTKFLEPSGYTVLDMFPKLLKMGMVKESNYGSIQRNAALLNDATEQDKAVKSMLSDRTTNALRRMTELEREASQRFEFEKNRVKQQGLPEKEAGRFAIDQLPKELNSELAAYRLWKNGYYKPLKEKAELALYNNDSAAAERFLTDIDLALDEIKGKF